MDLVCYYPLKDRLIADLFRQWLVAHCTESHIGNLVDRLTHNHPLPHFSASLSDQDASRAQPQLIAVSASLSLRILGEPDHWLGRERVLRQVSTP